MLRSPSVDREDSTPAAGKHPARGPSQDRLPRSWAGYVAAAWVASYLLLMHMPILIMRHPLLPWPEDPTPGNQMPGTLTEIGVMVTLAGAAGIGLALVRPWGRAVPRWLLLGIAWIGCVIGVAHWAIWSVQFAGQLINGLKVPVPAGVAAEAWQAYGRSLAVLNLTLYEPWFLGTGLLLGLAAWQNVRRARAVRQSIGAAASSTVAQPPPAWMLARGWPSVAIVPWAVVAVGVQVFWVMSLDVAWRQLGCAVGALVCAGAALLGQFCKYGYALNLTRVIAGIAILGGLGVTMFGIVSFAPWVFAFYGPGLMVGGMLLELASWPARLRANSGKTVREVVDASEMPPLQSTTGGARVKD